MHKALTLLQKATYSVSIAAAVAFSSTAPATTLGLSDSPMFLATGAEPNLIMTIDDSGSMDNEVLFPTNDGAAWWRAGNSGQCDATDNNSFVGCRNNATGTDDIRLAGQLNFNNAGNSSSTWKKYVYLFPNGLNSANNSGRRRSGDSDNDHFAIPPLPAFAWARSPNHNKAYFNPKVAYAPWASNGSYSFEDSSPTAARFDPVFETNLTMSLITDRSGNGSSAVGTTCNTLPANQVADNFYFKVYTGMTLPIGTCIRRQAGTAWEEVRTNPCQIGVNNGCRTTGNTNTFRIDTGSRVAIRYYPATFFVANPATDLPANYGYTGTTISGLAPNGTALTGYEIKRGNFASEAQYNQAIQRFANWFTYYRKRHQALRAGLGEAFSDVTGVRVDGFTINNTNPSVTMGSIDNVATRSALYTKFYTQWTGNGGTPNRSAVARMIQQYKRTDSNAPITRSCQRNFGMLFTDGFSNSPANGDGINGVYGAEDNGALPPYGDSVNATLADATFKAYNTPLRTDTAINQGRVPVPEGCPTSGPYTGPLDCNRNPHMNFFAVTLGAKGLQFNPDSATPQNPFTAPYPVWPTTFPARHPSAVDDLWHATINGRGQLLNASSPDQIATQLNAVLSSIKSDPTTAASASLNSGSISDGSFVYQAQFRPGIWTGSLLSYSLDASTGNVGDDRQESSLGANPDSRDIYTLNSEGDGVAFTWSALSADSVRVQQLAPGTFATDADRAVEAERMLRYLRGSSQNEERFNSAEDKANPSLYRGRYEKSGTANKLGDIVSSAPLYVGAPAFRYRDSFQPGAPYSQFVEAQLDRTPMVYVGANDGMLHAFYADGTNRGREAFAYVPGGLFPTLRELASKTYGHRFYVDGSPSMGDAYFSGAWHTIVAGGLNKGGQLIYALDVTNPDSFNGDSILWEFSDADDRDLGYTYSQPSIVKLGDNRWYVVFGNGYNSMQNDDPTAPVATRRVSQTGNAVLYLVDIETKDVIKLDTGQGYSQRPTGVGYGNGLATPSVVDLNGDRRIDVVYAGDLYGNMWKFDVSASNNDNWNVAFNGAPLFIARNDLNQAQPITVRPEVARGPRGSGQVVLFGTGKYLEPADKDINNAIAQSFYGIYDMGSPVTYTTSRAGTLLEQEIISEPPVNRAAFDNQVRVTTLRQDNNASGWYMDLVSPDGFDGERQVSNPTVRNGAVVFTTLVPSEDPCDFGGSSWLMNLDALTGSRLATPPFDLNRDGQFTTADGDDDSNSDSVFDADGNPISPGGIRFDVIVQAPAFGAGRLGSEETGRPVQYIYLPGSDGNMRVVITNPGASGAGRQSWRQVR